VGQHFWARGFFVNTVGYDEEAIRAYIRKHPPKAALYRSKR
jgi:putative transposase